MRELQRIEYKLDYLIRRVHEIIVREAHMAGEMEALEAQLEADTNAVNAMGTLVEAMLAEIEANKTNPSRVQHVVDKWKANTDKLVALGLANTTPVPPVVVEPPFDPNASGGSSVV